MAYEETTFMLNFSSKGVTLNFIAWKKPYDSKQTNDLPRYFQSLIANRVV